MMKVTRCGLLMGCDFQRSMILLRWLPQKRRGNLSRRPTGPSENYTMHKVETAGHAGTELGLSRLPVLKLLPGRAAIVGAQGEPTGG